MGWPELPGIIEKKEDRFLEKSMNRDKIYLISAIGFGLLVIITVLFMPGKENKNQAGSLWDRDWEVIEYYANGNSFSSAGNTSYVTENPDIKLIRKSGLLRSKYYVARKTKDKRELLFRAGSQVKNLFQTWEKPSLQGAYPVSSIDNNRAGFSKNSNVPRLLLYHSKDSKPVIVHIGGVATRGNNFVKISNNRTDETVFIISENAFRTLKNNSELRDRRLVDFSRAGQVTGIKIAADGIKDFENIELSVVEEEIDRENSEDKTSKKSLRKSWQVNGKIVSMSAARSVESAIKRLNIKLFLDDDRLQGIQAKESQHIDDFPHYEIRVKLEDGPDKVVTIYSPVTPIVTAAGSVVPARNMDDEITNYISAKSLDQILQGIKLIREELLQSDSPEKK